MSDLIDRIRLGHLDAIADPATPLHIMAEPGAWWWTRGRGRALVMINLMVGQLLDEAGLRVDPREGDKGSDYLDRMVAALPSVPAEISSALAVIQRFPHQPSPFA